MSPAGWEGLAAPGLVLVLVLTLAACGGGASAGALPDGHASIEGAVTRVRPFVPRTDDCVTPSYRPPDAPVSSDEPPECDQPPTDQVGALRVEQYPDRQVGDPRLPTAGEKAVVTVTTDTRILRQTKGALETAAFDDLATRQQVAVWFGGPVAESYPVQATAATIVFRPSG